MHRQEAFPGDEGERETFEGECSGAAGQIKAAPGSMPIQNQRNRELCRKSKTISIIYIRINFRMKEEKSTCDTYL